MSATAVVFPGQGSQFVGMMKEFAASYPLVKARYQEASDLLGCDLWDICQNDSDARLNQTIYTQPILLVAGYVSYEILKQETGLVPDYLAGHSLGEYTALCAAGAMTFAEAVPLVHKRGELMQKATPSGEGAMAAIIGLSDKEVSQLCDKVGGEVTPANYNSPQQIVIAGKKTAVEKAIAAAKEAGAKRALPLPISVPAHSPLMRPAAANFSLSLDQVHWQDPAIEIIYNVDAEPRHNKFGIESALGAQLYSPVLWRRCIEKLAHLGVGKCIEASPGKVLTGLNRKITSAIDTVAFDRPEALEKIKTLLENA